MVMGYYVDAGFSLSGEMSDYGASEIAALTSAIAVAAGVSTSAVSLRLSAASVHVAALIEFDTEAEATQMARLLAGTATSSSEYDPSRAIFASVGALSTAVANAAGGGSSIAAATVTAIDQGGPTARVSPAPITTVSSLAPSAPPQALALGAQQES